MTLPLENPLTPDPRLGYNEPESKSLSVRILTEVCVLIIGFRL